MTLTLENLIKETSHITNKKLVTGYKISEIGIIPEDWEVKKIEDLVTFIGAGKSKPNEKNTNFPVFGSTGIIGYNDNYDYKDDAILIARVGANAGKVNIVTGLYGVTDNTIILKFQGSYDINFIFNVLEKSRLNKFIFGSGQPLITGSQIKNLKISIPILQEQQAIAAALSDIDSLISSLDELIAKKRNIKLAAMQQLLTGKQRLPGFSGEWQKKQLGDVAYINMGQSPDSKNYNFNGNGLPLIQGNADIKNKKSIYRVWTTHITKICDKGDLILTVRAPVGSIAIAIDASCLGRGVCSLKPMNVSKDFLFHAMVFAEESWKIFEQGSTFTSANSAQIAGFPLMIPNNKKEQTAISNVLSDMDTDIFALEQQLDKARNLKQGMMQELLTGRIRLT